MELATTFNNNIAACPVCKNAFDPREHFPRVLDCGHSLCTACVRRMIELSSNSYVEGEVIAGHIQCPICRKNTYGNEIASFRGNYQLIDALKANQEKGRRDAMNSFGCSKCRAICPENQFRICCPCPDRESDSVSVESIIEEMDLVALNNLAICGNCVLEDHKTPGHKLTKLLPIRMDISRKKKQLEMVGKRSEFEKVFSDLKEKFRMAPNNVESAEKELANVFEMVVRASSSAHLEDLVKSYTSRMNELTANTNKMLEYVCSAERTFKDSADRFKRENEISNATLCNPVIIEKVVPSIASPMYDKFCDCIGIKSKAEFNFAIWMLLVFLGLAIEFVLKRL